MAEDCALPQDDDVAFDSTSDHFQASSNSGCVNDSNRRENLAYM